MKAQPLGRAVVGLAVAAALATSGCAAGRYAETRHEKTTLDGTNVQKGDIALRGLSLEAPAGVRYLKGSDARVNLVLVNNGERTEALTGISTGVASGWAAYDTKAVADSVHASANASASSVAAGATQSVAAPSATSSSSGAARGTPAAGSSSPAPLPAGKQTVRIPPGERVSFGVPDATGGLLLTGLTGSLYPGSTVTITFTFARAGTLKAQVPVQVSANPGDETVGGAAPTLGG